MSFRKFMQRRKRKVLLLLGKIKLYESFLGSTILVCFILSTLKGYILSQPQPRSMDLLIKSPTETSNVTNIRVLTKMVVQQVSRYNPSNVKVFQHYPVHHHISIPETKVNMSNSTNNSTCLLSTMEKKIKKKCQPRLDILTTGWKNDTMFSSQGVDGTSCCLLLYLNKAENICPDRPWFESYTKVKKNITIPREEAPINLELESLLQQLKDPGTRKVFAFVRSRIIRNWDNWKKGALNLIKKQNMNKRMRKRILVYPGVMTKKSGLKYVENQFKGAPLGELVQWTDLITVLYILGHDLTLVTEFEHLQRLGQIIRPNQSRILVRRHCRPSQSAFDLIYTDILGLHNFKQLMGRAYDSIKCLFRIVDSFGTEAPYNDNLYATKHKIKTYWGQQNLQLQQFNTLYPHTPDNSFLGFVVERQGDDDSIRKLPPKKNMSLIYAKDIRMWKDALPIVEALNKHIEVHATVNIKKHKYLPRFVINHGVLPGDKLHDLLKQIKIFVGFPTSPKEGPGALEAIGYGAVYINPIFNPPHVYKNKPTTRQITSINPYAEMHIGYPHVYTVNIKNFSDIEKTVKAILKEDKFEPYMAFEFTHEGMLQRINAYIVHQDFCSTNEQKKKWPPLDVVTFELAEPGVTCKDHCWNKKKVCEPVYLEDLNTRDGLAKVVQCSGYETKSDDFLYPSLDETTRNCTLQGRHELLGCAGKRPRTRRFCPCRTFMKGQSALCPSCL